MGNYITETPAHKILLWLKIFIDLVEKCVITAQQTFYSLIIIYDETNLLNSTI
jgi:hypothetical protein